MVMLIYTVVFTAGGIGLLIGCFIWFNGDGSEDEERDCSLNIALISMTCVMFFLVLVLWVREDSSIFTSALVNLWLTYLLWSGLASNPDEKCNTLLNSGWTTFLQIFTHLIWTWITLFSLSTAISSDADEPGQNHIA
jgi:hypothetical protein